MKRLTNPRTQIPVGRWDLALSDDMEGVTWLLRKQWLRTLPRELLCSRVSIDAHGQLC